MINITENQNNFFKRCKSPILIYGCTRVGYHCARFLEQAGYHVDFFVDKNKEAREKWYFGYEIIELEDIKLKMWEKECYLIITVEEFDSVLLQLYKMAIDIMVNVLVPKKFGDGNNCNNLLLSPLRKKLLQRSDITIISNNCSDMLIYDALGIQPRSPFLGSGISQEDFLKLAQNLQAYLKEDLQFGGYVYRGLSLDPLAIYPVGILGDITIYFRHCSDWNIAENLWKNQLKKVNMDTVYWIFSDFQEVLRYPIVKKFSLLNINKCIFLTKSMYNLPGIVYLAPGNGNFLDKKTVIEEWFDLIGWINGEYVM